MASELEDHRWVTETWRQEQTEMWKTHHNHIFVGSGKFANKHGFGIVLDERWRQRIIDTKYLNERAITTTILVNRQHINLMNVHFLHSNYADNHIEKTIENHMPHCDKYIPIIGGDFNDELGPEKERNVKVSANTLSTRETQEVTG